MPSPASNESDLDEKAYRTDPNQTVRTPWKLLLSFSHLMSFGKPSSTFSVFRPTPPDRGSFPLDHDGAASHQDSTLQEWVLTGRPVVQRRRMQSVHGTVPGMSKISREHKYALSCALTAVLGVQNEPVGSRLRSRK
jgi:hypothetical protein